MTSSGGPCCPGKSPVRKISVGGQLIGVSFLDQIIDKALESEELPEQERRLRMLKELKVYNYVPPSAEGDYMEAVWEEYVRERTKRQR